MSAIEWSDAADFSAVSERPGVYLFRDGERAVLYVGKASNLRARLRSYRRAGADGRILIRFMEREARSVETIVTRTEQEALLLEDSLIKTHKPPHNIRLKDDKSFLMLRLDGEARFPRFEFVRAHHPDRTKGGRARVRGRLFGPFASASAVRQTLSDLHRVVPMRDCPDTVMNHRSRPCLKHQIGLCAAPCVGLIDAAGYALLVEKASAILGGDTAALECELEGRMLAASQTFDYERAAQWRDRLAALRRTVEGQGVRPPDRVRRDVLAIARKGAEALAHRLAFRDGRMTESRSHRFRSELPEPELLHDVVTALYGGARTKGEDPPAEIVIPAEPADRDVLATLFGDTKLIVPKSGERLRMLDLASENARVELARQTGEESEDERALADLAAALKLERAPDVIDCFDISTMQGSHTVASRVRFRAGHKDKDGYRRFKIRGVEGQDDFASMREVVLRSLKRGVADGDVPDLVVIDGGAAQLEKALEAREEAGAWEVQMVALAKARSERRRGKRQLAKSDERVFVPGAVDPIVLTEHQAAKHLLERVRDEAHRFAITYHRKERGRIKSELDSIPGIGAAKRKTLLRAFGSVQGVRAANVESLAALPGIGRELALAIHAHLHRA